MISCMCKRGQNLEATVASNQQFICENDTANFHSPEVFTFVPPLVESLINIMYVAYTV